MINNYSQNIPYGAVKDVVPSDVGSKLPPNIQNYDIKDTVNNNAGVKSVKNASIDPLTIGLTGGIWLAFAQGCQALNKSLGNNWENSWLGKIGRGAETFAKKLNLTKGESFIKKKKLQATDRFKILRSFATPTKPQNTFAVSQARGITGYVMSDVGSMLSSHLKNGHGDDILKLAQGMDGFSGKTGQEALDYIENLFKNCENNTDKIKELIKRLNNSNVKVSVENIMNVNPKIPFTKKHVHLRIPNIPFLKRKGSFKEMANKLNAVTGNEVLGSQTTALGKSMPKQALKTLEGLTNGAAGGKLLIVIQAAIFAQAIKKAIDAPKGEKVSTFTENITSDFAMFLSLPLQVKASHAIGGLKYIGIGSNKDTAGQKQAIEKFHQMVKALNDKVDAGTISRIDYKNEKAAIKKFLKGDSKWYHKPFKFIGNIFSTGLKAETVKPFTDANTSGAVKFLKKAGNFIKGRGAGTVLRFGFGMLVVGSLVQKVAVKASHLIFGKPTNSILDEDKKDEQKSAEAKNPLDMTQEELMQKLAEHPEIVNKLQSDPAFAQTLLNDPETLKKLLNGEMTVDSVLQTQNNSLLNSKYMINPNQVQNPKPAQNPQPQATQPAQNPQQQATQVAQASQPAQNPQLQPQQAPQTAQTTPKASLNALDNDLPENPINQPQTKMNAAEESSSKENNPVEEKKTDEPQRTYIPSSAPVVITNDGKKVQTQEGVFDEKITNALNNADAIEAQAMKNLGL